MPYGGGYSRLSSKNSKLNQYNFIKNSKRGAILIEFAFAVPVLFSLIYYLQDLAIIKRWHSKLDFSLHCAANMFQNTQNITKKNFAHICYASVVGMFEDPARSLKPDGYTETPIVLGALCITGTDKNKGKINWYAWSDITAARNSYNVRATANMLPNAARLGPGTKNLRIQSIYDITQFDPTLTINPGETKIFLEISVYKGRCTKDYDRDYFKLFFAKVPAAFSHNGCQTLMNRHIVFTPKPGTFDPNRSPQ